jgi:lipoic acid synthetase
MSTNNSYIRKPKWLKIRLPRGEEFAKVNALVKKYHMHTICTSGNCPNHADCWERGTATLMILGDICTRACKFCNVTTGKPFAVDPDEPMNVALTVKEMGLKHCVLTSVDRDDLPDGGAHHWAETIRKVKELNPTTTLETLIPDFEGKADLIGIVISAKPEVISHNLETVRRLTPEIRTKAKYDTSLKVISTIAQSGLVAKTGIMLGLGETEEEILQTMDDALAAGCSVFTLGQYLQPTRQNFPVQAYITPEKFEEYKQIGLAKGFKHVESSPLVRSSYHAEKHINQTLK